MPQHKQTNKNRLPYGTAHIVIYSNKGIKSSLRSMRKVMKGKCLIEAITINQYASLLLHHPSGLGLALKF